VYALSINSAYIVPVRNRIASLPLRPRLLGLFGVLAAANVVSWAWALVAFRDQPLLLGTALLAWGFGARHAVDADHIAAIDNVTRKLMQDGQRPVTVGFFFALGHSAVVTLAAAGVAMTATFLGSLGEFRAIGGLVGTLASAMFLLAIAAVNTMILLQLWRTFRQVRSGTHHGGQDLDPLLSGGGLLARLFRPLFGLVTQAWHMFPLGFLFGLGFDTATEVALLSLSATQGAQGLSLWSVMAFPALFAAGMSLVDSADGVLMLGAYDWAFARPLRKLFYNLTITLISVLVAVLIAGIELLGLLGERLGLSGRFWHTVGAVTENSGKLGFVVIGAFVVIWIGAAAFWRYKGLDRIEAADD
jgi:nickel/cobalt transporter (NiCoT) family protein